MTTEADQWAAWLAVGGIPLLVGLVLVLVGIDVGLAWFRRLEHAASL